MWHIAIFSILALALPTLALWTYKWRNPKCKGTLPPGSMGLPIIGESLDFFSPCESLDIPPFLRKRIQKFGPVFKTHLVGRPVVMSSDVDFNNFIFQQEGKSVQFWYMDSLSKLIGINDEVTGNVHKYIKKLISEHFGVEKIKHKMLSELEQIVEQSLSTWTQHDSIEMRRSLSKMILNYAVKELFSFDLEGSNEDWSDSFFDLIKSFMSIPLNIPGTALHACIKSQQKVMKRMRDLIKEKRNDTSKTRKQRNDFLDHIMEDMESHTFLTDEFITYVMFTLTFASVVSIPTTLALAIKFVNENPPVVKKLQEEHEKIMQKKLEEGKRGLTWEDYKSMTFTNNVINETLRLSNSFGIVRKTTKDVHFNGYTIPEGWAIILVSFVLHLNPETFKNPFEFNPWRWEESLPHIKGKNFIPFGVGTRTCPGAEFSKVLMTIFLHVLFTKYNWNVVKESRLTRAPLLDFEDGFYINVNQKED